MEWKKWNELLLDWKKRTTRFSDNIYTYIWLNSVSGCKVYTYSRLQINICTRLLRYERKTIQQDNLDSIKPILEIIIK